MTMEEVESYLKMLSSLVNALSEQMALVVKRLIELEHIVGEMCEPEEE